MNQPIATASDPSQRMRSYIKCIATGPALSKNLSRAEARDGLRLILEQQVDPVQAGVFLIALRMKRETDEENLGVLDALRAITTTVTAAVDQVVDIAEPYNGFDRCLPASPFLPALLAALGLPAVSHGLETVGPKFGVTHRQILRAAGAPVDLTPTAAAARLADPACGWTYLDQSHFAPKLHALTGLRTLIVKRPAITTVENVLGPLRGRYSTHLITGYVHKAYPRIYARLARAAGFDSALIVRGVEGGVIPSLRQSGQLFYYHDLGAEQEQAIQPTELGIEQPVRAVPLPPEWLPVEGEQGTGTTVPNPAALAEAAATAGLAALAGQPGPGRDSLVYGAALCLWHLRRYATLAEAAEAARAALDSGQALACFQHRSTH
jgi:anthranilate phosphoribosyltransferase